MMLESSQAKRQENALRISSLCIVFPKHETPPYLSTVSRETPNENNECVAPTGGPADASLNVSI